MYLNANICKQILLETFKSSSLKMNSHFCTAKKNLLKLFYFYLHIRAVNEMLNKKFGSKILRLMNRRNSL